MGMRLPIVWRRIDRPRIVRAAAPYAMREVMYMSETVRRPGWTGLALILALTLLLGGAAGLLNRDGMQRYEAMTKPGFAPPGWVFPVVWTLLYAAMSVSLWLALRTGQPWRKLIVLYAVQLAVNLAWPFLFFTLGALGLAFWWLLLLLVLIILLMCATFPRSAPAGWLLVPYAVWVAFAGVLNFAIARLNP